MKYKTARRYVNPESEIDLPQGSMVLHSHWVGIAKSYYTVFLVPVPDPHALTGSGLS